MQKQKSILKNKAMAKKVEHLKKELDRLGVVVEYTMYRKELHKIPKFVNQELGGIQTAIISCITRLY